jgi:hypothetical protein
LLNKAGAILARNLAADSIDEMRYGEKVSRIA